MGRTDDALFAGFAEWVAAQPANSRYDYQDCKNCAVAQFLRASGFTEVTTGATCAKADGRWLTYPDHIISPIGDGEWTFGALAERLRQAA